MATKRAIYEISFRAKSDPEVISDIRRLVFPASTAGFMRAARWAINVAEDNEFVSDIKLLTVEKP